MTWVAGTDAIEMPLDMLIIMERAREVFVINMDGGCQFCNVLFSEREAR